MYLTNIFDNFRNQTVQIENNTYVIRRYNDRIWGVRKADRSLLKYVPLINRIIINGKEKVINGKEKVINGKEKVVLQNILKQQKLFVIFVIHTKKLVIQKARCSNPLNQVSADNFQKIGRYEIRTKNFKELINLLNAQTQKGIASKKHNEKPLPLHIKKDKNLLNDVDLRGQSIEVRVKDTQIEARVKDTQRSVTNIQKMSEGIQELNQEVLLKRLEDIQEHSNNIRNLIIKIQLPVKKVEDQYIKELNDHVKTQFQKTLYLHQDFSLLDRYIDKVNVNVQKLSKNIKDNNIKELSINIQKQIPSIQEQIKDIKELIIDIDDLEKLTRDLETQDIEERIQTIQNIEKQTQAIHNIGKDIRNGAIKVLTKDIEKLSINVENQNTISESEATEKPKTFKTINKKDFVGVVHNGMLIVTNKKNKTDLKDFIKSLKENEYKTFKNMPYYKNIAIIPTKNLHENNCFKFSSMQPQVQITESEYRTVEVNGIEEPISVTADGLEAAQRKLSETAANALRIADYV